MTYLNPALWGGIFLAALPILIHLLGRRRLRRQLFSTLQFLKRLQLKRMRRLRIKQWLLLLLRTLAVLALALAFLRPALQKVQAGSRARLDTVILLDMSASMGARRPDGMPWIKAQEVVRDIFSETGRNDRFALVVEDAGGERDIPWYTPQGGNVPWLEKHNVDGRGSDLSAAWLRAARLLKESAAPRRELIWISDFTGAPPDSLPALPENVEVIRIPVSNAREAPNAAVVRVRSREAILRPDRPISLEVQVDYSGGETPVKAILSVSVEGRRVAEGEVTLTPGQPTVHNFTLQLRKTGRFAGEAEVELEDALPLDNRFPFIMNIPSRRKVFIGGDDLEAMRLFQLALDPDGNNSGYFDLDIRPGNLVQSDLSSYDVLVLAGKTSYRIPEIRRIEEFVRSGGGVWILLGERSDLPNYSRDLLSQLGFGEIREEIAPRSGTLRWEDLDRTHPALRGLLEHSGRYDIPQVKRIFRVQEKPGDRPLVRLNDGSVFLLERSLGRGLVWWTPSAADSAWTDWSLSGIFAPLVQAGVSYLSSGGADLDEDWECGQAVFWPMENERSSQLLEAQDPLGNLVPVTAAFRFGRRMWRSEATSWPGHYRLLAGDREIGLAAVHVPREESRLTIREDPERKWPGQVLSFSEDKTVASVLREMRHGRELSGWLLLLAFLALVAETLLARERRPRSEPAVILTENVP